MTRILLFLVLLCGVSSTANAQGKSIYGADIVNEPYVELTGQDFIIPDNSPYWQDVSVVRDATFPGWGREYDMNNGVKVVLESGYLFMTNATHSFTLYAFQSDLEPRRGTGQTSEFSFKLDQGEGEKVLKLQWKNMGLEAGGDDEFLNYQVWMYENGLIEVRFGPTFIRSSSLTGGEGVIGLHDMDDEFSMMFNQAYFRGSLEFPVLDYGPIGGFSSIPDSSIVFKFIPELASVDNEIANNAATHAIIAQQNFPLTEAIKSIHIFSTLGVTVLEASPSNGQNAISIAMLPSGVYHVRMTTTRGDVITQRLLKR